MLGQQILGWKSKDVANKTADEFLGFSNGHWISPAGGPGQLVAFDLLYFASTHGEEVRSMYKGELGGRGHWNNGGSLSLAWFGRIARLIDSPHRVWPVVHRRKTPSVYPREGDVGLEPR